MAEPIERYIPANIEEKWQKKWEQDGLYQCRYSERQEEILRAHNAAISFGQFAYRTTGMR